jgi:hypothetical protein
MAWGNDRLGLGALVARKTTRDGRTVYIPENAPDKFFYSLAKAERYEGVRALPNRSAYEKKTGKRWDPAQRMGLDEKALERLPSGAPRYYFSMHDVDRLGVNPNAEYETTPLGVYTYPLTTGYLGKLMGGTLPYAKDSKYVTFLEAVQPEKMLYLGDPVSQEEYDLVQAASLSSLFQRADKALLASLLSKRLRELGYTSVSDPGTGGIHPSEPDQAVFLTPRAYRILDRVVQTTLRRGRLPAPGPGSARTAALATPESAVQYARDVDKGPRDDTRKAASKDPKWAYLYALDVDKGPRDDTRKAASKDPAWAYLYARRVDRWPRDDTRKAASKDPRWAFEYARDVDQGPRDDTRKAASKDPRRAFEYARDVDHSARDDTRKAASRSRWWRREYDRWFA